MNIQTNEKENEVMFKDIKPAEVFSYKGSILMKLKSRYTNFSCQLNGIRLFNAINLYNADTEYFNDDDNVVRVDHTLNIHI